MFKIGLTGGIGSGKSTVCQLFREYGVNTIDADLISRDLVAPGRPTLKLLADTFGHNLIQGDGSLDRAKLRDLIFSQPPKKQQLENILHPLIYQQIELEVEKSHGPYCVVAVPLLFETHKQSYFDRILVIDCDLETQVARVIARNQLNREQILAIISSQMPRELRLQLTDDLIENSATVSQLAEQIKRLHNSYNLLATARITSA